MDGNVLIIIPAYREKENINLLLKEIFSVDKDFQVLFVNDDLSDGTKNVIDAFLANDNRVHAIHRASKAGFGSAYKEGFGYALSKDFEFIINMDADLSHHPKSIPDILKSMSGADIVLGSRYVNGSSIVYWPYHRYILSRACNSIIKALFGFEINDCTSGFRCYRRKVLEGRLFDKIYSENYGFVIEFLYKCQKTGYKIKEVPITFVNRKNGKSKISFKRFAQAFFNLLKLKICYR